MEQGLADDQLAQYREAFARRDTTGDGNIAAGDLCELLRSLGVNPSGSIQLMSRTLADEGETITFSDFLDIVAGAEWRIPTAEHEDLIELFAESDGDGTGRIPLRDLMRTFHKYLDRCCYNLNEDELIGIYRQILDASVFHAVHGKLDHGIMWKFFEDEFDKLRREDAENADVDEPEHSAGADVTPGQHCNVFFEQDVGIQTGVVHLVVVNLGGDQLLSDSFASSSSVEEVQLKIEQATGLPTHLQLLFHAGHGQLHQQLSLSEMGIVDGSVLVLVEKVQLEVNYTSFANNFMRAEF